MGLTIRRVLSNLTAVRVCYREQIDTRIPQPIVPAGAGGLLTLISNRLDLNAAQAAEAFRTASPIGCFYMASTSLLTSKGKENIMSDSVYKVIQLVGTSSTSWEDAAKNAVETAGASLRDLRVAEIAQLDMKVENGKVTAFRARVNLSFKYGSD